MGDYISDYDKTIQRQKEWDAWASFKKAVEDCVQLKFSKKQLMGHIQIKRYSDFEDEIKGEGIDE